MLRFVTGIGVGGTLPVDYTMMAEFLPSERRDRWLVLLESFWALGTICLALLALAALSWGDDAWRVIFFVTGLPALIGVVLRFYIPESPMYLNRNGKSGQARKVLERVARVNGRPTDIPELKPELHERKPLSALFSNALRRRSIALCGLGADLHRLLRRVRLPADQAQQPGLRLHARPGIPGAAGAGAVARLRAVGLRGGTLGPQAHAGRL